jgi:hypothetical protein
MGLIPKSLCRSSDVILFHADSCFLIQMLFIHGKKDCLSNVCFTVLQMCSCRVVERCNLQLQLTDALGNPRRSGVCGHAHQHTDQHTDTHTDTHTDQHTDTHTDQHKHTHRHTHPEAACLVGGDFTVGRLKCFTPPPFRPIRPRLHPLHSCFDLKKTQTGSTSDVLSTEVV